VWGNSQFVAEVSELVAEAEVVVGLFQLWLGWCWSCLAQGM
jgi:hypothetical protein